MNKQTSFVGTDNNYPLQKTLHYQTITRQTMSNNWNKTIPKDLTIIFWSKQHHIVHLSWFNLYYYFQRKTFFIVIMANFEQGNRYNIVANLSKRIPKWIQPLR